MNKTKTDLQYLNWLWGMGKHSGWSGHSNTKGRQTHSI